MFTKYLHRKNPFPLVFAKRINHRSPIIKQSKPNPYTSETSTKECIALKYNAESIISPLLQVKKVQNVLD